MLFWKGMDEMTVGQHISTFSRPFGIFVCRSVAVHSYHVLYVYCGSGQRPGLVDNFAAGAFQPAHEN